MRNKYFLSEINIYPIKSLGGISLQSATVEERGLQYDRRLPKFPLGIDIIIGSPLIFLTCA